jgi:hypothetical protein
VKYTAEKLRENTEHMLGYIEQYLIDYEKIADKVKLTTNQMAAPEFIRKLYYKLIGVDG